MIWNKVAILKQLWDIATKKEWFWVKWAHEYYIKSLCVYQIRIPVTASWMLRKILDQRKLLVHQVDSSGHLIKGEYNIKKAYKKNLDHSNKVPWGAILVRN